MHQGRSGAFVSLLNKGARIDILWVLLNHKVYKLYKMYRLTLNSRNITMIDLFTWKSVNRSKT